eukprot:scaffold167116_cov30-Tisochrysis_lutea.AAC.4
MEHKPGANHKDADGVSRLIAAEDGTSNSQQGREDILWLPPTGVAATQERSDKLASTTQESINLSYLEAGTPTAKILKEAQADDAGCRDLILALSASPLPSGLEYRRLC